MSVSRGGEYHEFDTGEVDARTLMTRRSGCDKCDQEDTSECEYTDNVCSMCYLLVELVSNRDGDWVA